jgi:hypothetical protein
MTSIMLTKYKVLAVDMKDHWVLRFCNIEEKIIP